MSGGAKYASFVEQELKAERARRGTLDGRGQAVVTTSGALAALLTAVGAIVVNRKGFVLPVVARYPLVSALAFFVIAAFFGILVTINFKYEVASKKTLSKLPRGHWADSDNVAMRNIVATNVMTIATLRRGNDTKVTLLLVALFAQLGALLSLAVTVFLAIRAG
jgi:hypothetical protein